MSTDPLDLARALIRCPSVTPEDGGALAVLDESLKKLGFTCHRMTFSAPGTADVDNLYARIGDTAPNFCFAGHSDVVPVGDAQGFFLSSGKCQQTLPKLCQELEAATDFMGNLD